MSENHKTEKVNVLHVLTRLISGGADENTLFTVEGLPVNQFQTFLAVGPESDPHMLQKVKKARLLMLPCLVRKIHPLNDLLTLIHLIQIIRKYKIKIVHTHVAKAGILGRISARICRVPLVIHTLHGITFHPHLPAPVRLLYLYLEKLTAHFTDKFICVGEDLRRTYIKNRVARTQKFCVIRSGFALEDFKKASQNRPLYRSRLLEQLNLPADAVLVGTAARLEPRKGVQYLIQAAERVCLEKDHIYFLVAGEGGYKKELKTMVAERGLTGRFKFLGYIQQIERFLAGLDIFVLSSLWEGLPRSIVQSCAVGTPVISFKVEGVSEIIDNGKNGFIVLSKDTENLAEKILFLASNPKIRSYFGDLSRYKVNSAWHYAEMVNRIRRLYDEEWTAKFKHPLSNYRKEQITQNDGDSGTQTTEHSKAENLKKRSPSTDKAIATEKSASIVSTEATGRP